MVTGRQYRAARTPAEALTELRRMAGRQFDGEIVLALERSLGLTGHIGIERRAAGAEADPAAEGLVA